MNSKELLNATLSDFCNLPIGYRDNGMATVVVEMKDGKYRGLAGFSADPMLTDFEIAELAYSYWDSIRKKLELNEGDCRD